MPCSLFHASTYITRTWLGMGNPIAQKQCHTAVVPVHHDSFAPLHFGFCFSLCLTGTAN